MKNPYVLIGVAAVIVAGVIFFLKTTSGKAVGAEVAGVVTGFVGGVGTAVADVANDPSINPLADFGTWLGGSIYDVTH